MFRLKEFYSHDGNKPINENYKKISSGWEKICLIFFLIMNGAANLSVILELHMILDYIPNKRKIKGIKKIKKGYSRFFKYFIETYEDKEKYLLQIGDATCYSFFEREAEYLRMLCEHGIPTRRLVLLNRCKERAFIITTWIEGEDLETLLPRMPKKKQYEFGLNAAQVLKKIHSISSYSTFEEKIVMKKNLSMFDCDNSEDVFYKFAIENLHYIRDEYSALLHGDFHCGNIVVDERNEVYVIDFVLDTYGDPWEDFVRNVVNAETSYAFAKGLVDGYFGKSVPKDFWRVVALYTSLHQLELKNNDYFIEKFGADFVREQHRIVSEQYVSMSTIIPRYYRTIF